MAKAFTEATKLFASMKKIDTKFQKKLQEQITNPTHMADEELAWVSESCEKLKQDCPTIETLDYNKTIIICNYTSLKMIIIINKIVIIL